MECIHIADRSYSALIQQLRENTEGGRLPLAGSIELTERCNLECSHCYINESPGDMNVKARELDPEAWYRIIDELADAGCLWLLISGGDPLLHPDFYDIYLHAKHRGLLITIHTNGTLITPRMARFFAEWPPFAIEISLYGHSEEVYELVTGKAGSHARCLDGVDHLLSHGLPVKLKTMLMQQNKHELAAMQKYANSRGVDFRWDAEINKRTDGGDQPVQFRISPEEIIHLEQGDAHRAAAWRDLTAATVDHAPSSNDLYICGAADTSFHIDAYGKLSACMMARNPAYDLTCGTFHEGWEEFLIQLRQQKCATDTSCHNCDLNSICSACPGWSQMEHGNEQQRVEYLCKITHQRAEALGLISENNKRKTQ